MIPPLKKCNYAVKVKALMGFERRWCVSRNECNELAWKSLKRSPKCIFGGRRPFRKNAPEVVRLAQFEVCFGWRARVAGGNSPKRILKFLFCLGNIKPTIMFKPLIKYYFYSIKVWNKTVHCGELLINTRISRWSPK